MSPAVWFSVESVSIDWKIKVQSILLLRTTELEELPEKISRAYANLRPDAKSLLKSKNLPPCHSSSQDVKNRLLRST